MLYTITEAGKLLSLQVGKYDNGICMVKSHYIMRNVMLCRSPYIVRIRKWRRLQWIGHVSRLWRQGMNTEIWKGNLLVKFEGDWRITWMDFSEVDCKDGMWLELAVDHV
jgi:hypothetical protein